MSISHQSWYIGFNVPPGTLINLPSNGFISAGTFFEKSVACQSPALITMRFTLVSMESRNCDEVITTLKAGDYFGETSIITSQPRAATVAVPVQKLARINCEVGYSHAVSKGNNDLGTILSRLCRRSFAGVRALSESACRDLQDIYHAAHLRSQNVLLKAPHK